MFRRVYLSISCRRNWVSIRIGADEVVQEMILMVSTSSVAPGLGSASTRGRRFNRPGSPVIYSASFRCCSSVGSWRNSSILRYIVKISLTGSGLGEEPPLPRKPWVKQFTLNQTTSSNGSTSTRQMYYAAASVQPILRLRQRDWMQRRHCHRRRTRSLRYRDLRRLQQLQPPRISRLARPRSRAEITSCRQ